MSFVYKLVIFLAILFSVGISIYFYLVPKNVMTLESIEFKNNGNIPAKFTCDGEDISPTFNIKNVPKGTKSLALIMDDPDAPKGTWVHWVVWNIFPLTTNFSSENLPEGAVEGLNSWPKNDYGGPCPPQGTHRYFFKLYALDKVLDIPSSSSLQNIMAEINGHLLEQAELIGLYNRGN